MTSHLQPMARLPAGEAQSLLEALADWGPLTTIIIHAGSVFEFKGPFPRGTITEGFYNLKGDTGFEGHLNLSLIDEIRLESKQHRGRDSYSFVFVNAQADVIFKVFLGRDAKGNIFEDQLQRFCEMQLASGTI